MGSNKLAGEVGFEAGGKAYVLRLGVNEMISLMDAWGIPPDDLEALFVRLQQLKTLTVLRELVLYALRRDQPTLTLLEAGDLITQVGFSKMGDLVYEAITWALPEPKPIKEGGGDGDDPKAPPASNDS
jgi:hypothetical protein